MAIEPPSQTLINHLRTLHLASEAQLHACQPHLKNLVRDLPAFDSVWIDALVQGEVLTPFQAKALTHCPESLKLGSHVLIDRLPHDNWPVRYRALPLTGGKQVAISVLTVSESELPAARDRFQRHVTAVQGLSHRNLCLATAAEESPITLQAIGPLPVGEPLDELFVRRGRFPADIVEEIARQSLEGLSRLELAGTLHGDLRLRNLLLCPGGRVLIINAGLLAAIHPQITIHGTLPIACYQGTAPELIGGRTERSPATEMYALGCLLWHLLAGRSPFLPADRLEQLAAHQSGTIADVRMIAPETPSHLAALIARLVARHPSERYRSLTTASAECGPSQARGRARLAQFQATFQSMVPVRLGQAAKTRRAASLQGVMTAAVLLVAAALFLFPGVGRSLLQSAGRMLHATQETPATTTEPPVLAVEETPSVPAPSSSTNDAQRFADNSTESLPERPIPRETTQHSGIFRLEQTGPYAPIAHSSVGDLRIASAEGTRAVIEIIDQPLKLAGRRVFLENISIRRGPHAVPGIPLVEVDTQSLSLTNCDLVSEPIVTQSPQPLLDAPLHPAIRWRHLDENDIQPGQIELQGCQFIGGTAALQCDSVPQVVRITDTVCLSAAAFCEVTHSPSARTLQISITRCTLRQTGPLLREHQLTNQRQTPVKIVLRQSVLDLLPGSAVVEANGSMKSNWRPQVTIESNGAYLAEGTDFISRKTDGDGETVPLDPANLDIEGLMSAEFQFAGPVSSRWNDQVVTQYTADVQSDELPGVTARERSPNPIPSQGTRERPHSR